MPMFLETRVPFIVLGDKDVRFDHSHSDSVREWAQRELHMTPDKVEQAIRGYIMPGLIQFYQGPNCGVVGVNPRLLDTVVQEHYATYGSYPDVYCSGVHMLGHGEQWPPIRTYNLRGYYGGCA